MIHFRKLPSKPRGLGKGMCQGSCKYCGSSLKSRINFGGLPKGLGFRLNPKPLLALMATTILKFPHNEVWPLFFGGLCHELGTLRGCSAGGPLKIPMQQRSEASSTSPNRSPKTRFAGEEVKFSHRNTGR